MAVRHDEVIGPLRAAYDRGPGSAAPRRAVLRRRVRRGGEQRGPIDDDAHVPPRFFSWRADEHLLAFAAHARFDLVDFHSVDTDRGYRFQSLTLRRPDPQ